MIGVQHRAILNIGVFADSNQVAITPQNSVEPDTCVVFEPHFSDDRGIVGDEEIVTGNFYLLVTQTVEYGRIPPGRIFT